MAKLEQEYAGRKVAFTGVHESVNKDVEDILNDEFPDEYITNGVRNWLKIQRDIAYIKRAVKSSGPPKREVVRSLLTKRNEDELEGSIGISDGLRGTGADLGIFTRTSKNFGNENFACWGGGGGGAGGGNPKTAPPKNENIDQAVEIV